MAVATKLTRFSVPEQDLVVVKENLSKNAGTEFVEDLFDGPCTVFGILVNSTSNNEALFLNLFNKTAITQATETPEYVFPIPIGVTFIPLNLTGGGVYFSTGFSWNLVTTGGVGGATGATTGASVTVYGKQN